MDPEIELETLNHIFFHNVEHFDRRCLLAYSENSRSITFSTRQFRTAVFTLCRFLRASGLQPEDRVAILSENRPEWHIADFAILLSRMISVPIYPTFSPAQMRYVLQQSQCSAVVLSSRKHWEIITALQEDLPHLRHAISMTEWTDQPQQVVPLPRLLREDCLESEDWVSEIREEALSVDPHSVATIVYTSGTTGPPKGVMLTHDNIAFDLGQGLSRLQFQSAVQALSVLPLSHAFERLLCYGYFLMGIPIAYGEPYRLAEHLQRYQPDVIPPRRSAPGGRFPSRDSSLPGSDRPHPRGAKS